MCDSKVNGKTVMKFEQLKQVTRQLIYQNLEMRIPSPCKSRDRHACFLARLYQCAQIIPPSIISAPWNTSLPPLSNKISLLFSFYLTLFRTTLLFLCTRLDPFKFLIIHCQTTRIKIAKFLDHFNGLRNHMFLQIIRGKSFWMVFVLCCVQY